MDIDTKSFRNLGEEEAFCTLTFRAEFFVCKNLWVFHQLLTNPKDIDKGGE